VIDACDPNPICLGRFSRFVRKLHRSPRAGTDPRGYLEFVLALIRREKYDVLLPVHEQILIFSRIRDRLPASLGIAIPEFDILLALMNKRRFIELLLSLNLPHPRTQVIRRRAELHERRDYPFYIKTPFGTASSGVWLIDNARAHESIMTKLETAGLLDGTTEFLVQDLAPGVPEGAQAIFDSGRLIAFHCYRMTASGLRGGMAGKVSISRPLVREHVQVLGRNLNWHGSINFDYLLDPRTEQPAYVDANPRLVEPMNAVFSGVNLADLLVRLSLGECIPFQEGTLDVCSHMLIQSFLGISGRGKSRAFILRELIRAILHTGIYCRSREELTPILFDPPSLIPLAAVAGQLLINPKWAERLGNRAVADYALTPFAINMVSQLK
jgi:predicted ATP-grasp superfamily ATP-dependent carboligase